MPEQSLRLMIFIGVLCALALAELVIPWREQQKRGLRWPSNLGLIMVDTLIVRLLFPISAAGLAIWCANRGIGAFNIVTLPNWLAFILSLLVLDLAIYGQHLLFHKVPVLWRLHRVHHTDNALDVTSGLRFHPVEIVLSLLIKMAVIAAMGIPAAAVVAFEVLLNATAMFNHANIRLLPALDRLLRLILVTPDMHRVHHSTIPAETDSNYGFNLPWWDKLFGTYRPAPRAGLDGVRIGVEGFSEDANQRIDRLLLQPFDAAPPEPPR